MAGPTRTEATTATTATATATTTTMTTMTTMTTTTTTPPRDDRLRRIAASARTPFEKRVWALLCQIPAGQVTTYALLAAHLGSSPRAVGNAMRRNPFAPDVPCHRCVATGGGLGGFKGVGGGRGRASGSGSGAGLTHAEGLTLDEKRALLRKEGVRFDDRGRVLGTPFQAFR